MQFMEKVPKIITIVLAIFGGVVVVGICAMLLLLHSCNRKIDAKRQDSLDQKRTTLLSHLEQCYQEEFLVKAYPSSSKYFLVAPVAEPELEFHARVAYQLVSNDTVPGFGYALDDDYIEVGLKRYCAVLSQRYPELDMEVQGKSMVIRVNTYEDIDGLYPRLKEIDVMADRARPFCSLTAGGYPAAKLELRIYGPDFPMQAALHQQSGAKLLSLPEVTVAAQEFETKYQTAAAFHDAVLQQYLHRIRQTGRDLSHVPLAELEKFPAKNFSIVTVNGEAYLNVRYDAEIAQYAFRSLPPKRYSVTTAADGRFVMERHAIFDLLTDMNVNVLFDKDIIYGWTDPNFGCPVDMTGNRRRNEDPNVVYEWYLGEDHYAMADSQPDSYVKNGQSYELIRHKIDDTKGGMNAIYTLEDIARMLDAEIQFDNISAVLAINSPHFSMREGGLKVYQAFPVNEDREIE